MSTLKMIRVWLGLVIYKPPPLPEQTQIPHSYQRMAHAGISLDALGIPWHAPEIIAIPPLVLFLAPAWGTFGIAHDLLFHNMEDSLPNGWAKKRGV
jgi:hypothetical protein